jgi:hypothetical protein
LELLIEAEKQACLGLNSLSVLRQISERLDLPISAPLLEELVALTRAQRRALRAAHRQLEADPLLAHLLESRISYRKGDEHRTKSGKRLEEMVRSSFLRAQSIGFHGEIEDWRSLLAIFPRS